MKKLIKIGSSFVLLLNIFALSNYVLAVDQGPGAIVKNSVDKALEILKDDELSEDQKRQFVYKVVSEHIDFKNMSQRILATNWKKATDEQKIEFVFLFEKIILDDYWVRIRQYSGEQIKYLAVSIDREIYATVDTVIVRGGTDVQIPITYRMQLKNGKWSAYDFLIESLSLIQNYRREYQAIIKNSGIKGLLEYMNNEITHA